MTKLEKFLEIINPDDADEFNASLKEISARLEAEVLSLSGDDRAEPLMGIMLEYGLVDESELSE